MQVEFWGIETGLYKQIIAEFYYYLSFSQNHIADSCRMVTFRFCFVSIALITSWYKLRALKHHRTIIL